MLQSALLSGDARLQACEVSDPAHLTLGTRGDFVKLVQFALFLIDGADIASAESDAGLYGTTTARAVLSYKSKRNIIAANRQTSADDIVGKMTIVSIDADMLDIESREAVSDPELQLKRPLSRR